MLQDDLDHVVEHWNTHLIRKSSNNSVSGRPDAIYHIPERYGGVEMKAAVSQRELSYVEADILQDDGENEYTGYFDYVSGQLSLSRPRDWKASFDLYHKLMQVAR